MTRESSKAVIMNRNAATSTSSVATNGPTANLVPSTTTLEATAAPSSKAAAGSTVTDPIVIVDSEDDTYKDDENDNNEAGKKAMTEINCRFQVATNPPESAIQLDDSQSPVSTHSIDSHGFSDGFSDEDDGSDELSESDCEDDDGGSESENESDDESYSSDDSDFSSSSSPFSCYSDLGSDDSEPEENEDDEDHAAWDDGWDDDDDGKGMPDERLPTYRTNNDDYYYEHGLAEGTYATVFKVINSDGREFAIKKIANPDKKQIDVEKDALYASDSTNVVILYDDFEQGGYTFFVLELCPFGTLEDLMLSRGRLTEIEAKILGRALAEGIHHLHGKGFLHRDLKPENIMFGENMVLKVGDLNLALNFVKDEGSGVYGTKGFIAPELERKEAHSPAMDVWGVGALLYFMLYGDEPHFDEQTKKVIPPTTNLEPRQLSIDAQAALEASLRGQVGDRLPMEELLKLPFFSIPQDAPVLTPSIRYGPPVFRPPSVPLPPSRRPSKRAQVQPSSIDADAKPSKDNKKAKHV
ncbi:hypothetical protein BGW39_001647 [Mortierella sp. 14UC]|nr:hypothetical protein BGW39_001647 [Mortierella sp. 14UC]